MSIIIEKNTRLPGGHAFLSVDGVPDGARVSKLRIAHGDERARYLSLVGWVSAPVDLDCVETIAKNGKLVIPLGPEVVDQVPGDELVRILLPQVDVDETVVWPDLPPSGKRTGGSIGIVHKLETKSPEVVPVEEPDVNPLNPAAKDAEANHINKPDEIADDENKTNENGGQKVDAKKPGQPPSRTGRWSLLAAVIFIFFLPALIVTGLHPYQMTPSDIQFSGAPGGPFTPSIQQAEVRRPAYFAWMEKYLPLPKLVVETDADWVAPLSHSPNAQWGSTMLTFRTAANFLVEGEYQAAIKVRTPVGISIPVGRVQLSARSSQRRLRIMPSGPIEFRGKKGGPWTPAQMILSVRSEAGSFDWRTDAGSVGWLSITPTTGHFARVGDSETLQIAPSTAASALQPGTYETGLAFSAGSGTVDRVIVRLIVEREEQRLTLTPQSPITFVGVAGGPFEPSVARIGVRSQGGAFSWVADGGRVDWLAVDPQQGRFGLSEGWQMISLRTSLAARSLGPGRYETSVTVRGEAGTSERVIVRLHINPRQNRLTVSPDVLEFSGEQGGPFLPATHRLSIRSESGVFEWSADSPNARAFWLGPLRGTVSETAPSFIDVSVASLEANTLSAGVYNAQFTIRPANGPLAIVHARLTVRQAIQHNQVCDRAAGNKYDPNHPRGQPAIEDTDTLSDSAIENGLRSCGLAARSGGSRYSVQQGRLLAARAVRRARAGQHDMARADMHEALLLWRGTSGSSAYALNLLGAYYFGTFNNEARGFSFVAPDIDMANQYWRRAAAGGFMPAIHNYASNLLSGRGLTRDTPRALGMLESNFSNGYALSGFLLAEGYLCRYHGVNPQPVSGYNHLRRAAELGNGRASDLLRRIQGRGYTPGTIADCRP